MTTSAKPSTIPLPTSLRETAREAYEVQSGATRELQTAMASRRAEELRAAQNAELRRGLERLGLASSAPETEVEVEIEGLIFVARGDDPKALSFCIAEDVPGVGRIFGEAGELFYIGHWIAEGRDLALRELQETHRKQAPQTAPKTRFDSPEDRLLRALREIIRREVDSP